MGLVVVGVDGSPCSVRALEVALDQALVHGWQLDILTAFVYEHVVGVPGAMWPVETYAEVEGKAERIQSDALSSVSAADLERLDVRCRTVFGHASGVLLEASDGADLLVVGSRGRGRIAGALLGSVSQHCVTHAACPVLVVRPGSLVTPTSDAEEEGSTSPLASDGPTVDAWPQDSLAVDQPAATGTGGLRT